MGRLFTKLLSAMLACAVTMTIAPVTTHAEGEDADAGYNVKIQYTGDNPDAETKYHYVQQDDGTIIYLYCLQSKRHWPHHTEAFGDPPSYRQISFQEFCENNELTDPTKITALAEKMRRVLYAGFNYNGLGLYSSSGKEPITADDFNSFLYLSDKDALRSDFLDDIGNYQFTYEKRDDPDQRTRISNFMKKVLTMGNTETKSGMEASQVEAMPFYKAAQALDLYAYYANNGLKMDPTDIFSNDAYDGTSYAVWTLSGLNKIKDSEVLSVAGIGKQLLDAANDANASILKEEPSVTPVLTQNAVFTYKDDDQKWHSSPITLSAAGISTRFSVTVSGTGKAVDSTGNEVTEIKPGESFSLVSDKEPSGDTKVSVYSSSVPWMVGDLVVYEPKDNSFQNMIGVVIHHTEMSAEATVRKVDETTSLSFTKQWNDDGNVSGKRPDVSSYAKSLTLLADGKEQSGYIAEITDNGDNTYTVSYKGLPKRVDGNAVSYSVKEATVEGYTSDSFDVSDGGTLVNTLVVPIPSPTATATVTVKENKPVRAVSPAVVKPVPPTGVESSYGENRN